MSYFQSGTNNYMDNANFQTLMGDKPGNVSRDTANTQANASTIAAQQQAAASKYGADQQAATARYQAQLGLQGQLAPLQYKQQVFSQLSKTPFFSSLLGNPVGFNVNGGGFSGGFGGAGGEGAAPMGAGGIQIGGGFGAPGAGGGGGALGGALGGGNGFNLGGALQFGTNGNPYIPQGPQFDTGPLFSQSQINQQVGNQAALNNQAASKQIKDTNIRLAAQGYGPNSSQAQSQNNRTLDAARGQNMQNATQTRFGLEGQNKQYAQQGRQYAQQQAAQTGDLNVRAVTPFVQGQYGQGNALVSALSNLAGNLI
jgi:hypothetical protein